MTIPRRKLLTHDSNLLTDAEVLAIILQTGCKHKSALTVAKELIRLQPNLSHLLTNLPYYAASIAGLSQAKVTSLLAAQELGRRLHFPMLAPGECFNNCIKTQQYLAKQLQAHRNEVFACLFLDAHLHLLQYKELFYGTINEAPVYPREIIRQALLVNAAKLILAHNHPSGRAQPSAADQAITHLVKRALHLMDIELVDHIIIGFDQHFSFAEHGFL